MRASFTRHPKLLVENGSSRVDPITFSLGNAENSNLCPRPPLVRNLEQFLHGRDFASQCMCRCRSTGRKSLGLLILTASVVAVSTFLYGVNAPAQNHIPSPEI